MSTSVEKRKTQTTASICLVYAPVQQLNDERFSDQFADLICSLEIPTVIILSDLTAREDFPDCCNRFVPLKHQKRLRIVFFRDSQV
jgi:hypothetical protein